MQGPGAKLLSAIYNMVDEVNGPNPKHRAATGVFPLGEVLLFSKGHSPPLLMGNPGSLHTSQQPGMEAEDRIGPYHAPVAKTVLDSFPLTQTSFSTQGAPP